MAGMGFTLLVNPWGTGRAGLGSCGFYGEGATGALFQAEVGVGGARGGVGFGHVDAAENDETPALSAFVLSGLGGTVSWLHLWDSEPATAADYVGVTAELTFLLNLELGVYGAVDAGSASGVTFLKPLFTWGLGLGF